MPDWLMADDSGAWVFPDGDQGYACLAFSWWKI